MGCSTLFGGGGPFKGILFYLGYKRGTHILGSTHIGTHGKPIKDPCKVPGNTKKRLPRYCAT